MTPSGEGVRRGTERMTPLEDGSYQLSSVRDFTSFTPVGFYAVPNAVPNKFERVNGGGGNGGAMGYIECRRVCASDPQCTGFFVDDAGSCNVLGDNPLLTHGSFADEVFMRGDCPFRALQRDED